MVDDDPRDERLAAWLEPEPLDDVTRRRLVSNAMRESRPSRTVRWVATAAAIVVVLVGALALLTAPGGHDEHQAAAPVRTPAGSKSDAVVPSSGPFADSAAPPENASGTAAAPAALPVDVGDFGNLDRAANRARLRTALDAGSSGAASSVAPSAASGAASALAALPCRDGLPAGTVLALGTGTLDGRDAVVVLTDLGDGSRSIDAVLAAPCAVRPLS